VLSLSIASQEFQPVRRRNPKVVELLSSVDRLELAARDGKYLDGKALRTQPVEDRFGDRIFESADQSNPLQPATYLYPILKSSQ
jgi:hypothetical protein